MTGVAAGTTTITYTLPTGCFITTTGSVNAIPAISGFPSVCLGNSITLSDATSGGSWSSSSPATASISSSGVLFGNALGSVNITYAVASIGCSAIKAEAVTTPPNTYSMTGGGSYCSGGIGVHVGLNSSDGGTTYYLFNGASLVTTATSPSNGFPVDFGLQTASGTYTAVAGFGSTCSATQGGSVTVSVNPLPTAFSVGGGGNYCSGGTGLNITLSSSTIGVNYQL